MPAALITDYKKGQCLMLSFLFLCAIGPITSHYAYANESACALTNAKLNCEQKETVVEWFAKYDQIRRDAELNFLEKFQTMSFLDKKLDHQTVLRKRDQELVERMSSKYAKAVKEMKNLPEVSATKELQDGYIDYFSQVQQIFTAYLKSSVAGDAPSSPSAMQEKRSALEELDFKNKKLDAELRQKFGIARHRHS